MGRKEGCAMRAGVEKGKGRCRFISSDLISNEGREFHPHGISGVGTGTSVSIRLQSCSRLSEKATIGEQQILPR
jgi:hypothetical protein